mgnify:CR=1 FL=1
MRFILVILFCLPLLIIGQVNLVPNPSFEDTSGITTSILNDIRRVSNWYDPTLATPDYYNDDYGTTTNIFQVYTSPRTGKAFVGFYTSGHTIEPNYREYVQVRLNQPLVAGKQYAVGYYYYYYGGYSITHELGFRFSYDTLAYPSWLTTPPATYYNHLGTDPLSYMDTNLALISAINNGGDTTAWYPLHTTYTAVGGEEYLTIGNLYGAANTNHTSINTPPSPISQTMSYFIVDDVYVLDIQQLQDTDLVYIDTFNVGVPITYNCIENSCTDPANATGVYSTLADCQAVCGASAIEENEAEKQLLKITDVLGRESEPAPNVPLFYRYSDGTVEKRLVIE